MSKKTSLLIIPTLNPDDSLIPYIQTLIANGFSKLIIVNDGSRPECAHIFNFLQSLPECDVLVHSVNMGKGRALKDAFNYYYYKYSKDFLGIITADSDGQHTIDDIIHLDSAMRLYPDSLTLGVRNFDDPAVPFKSKFGNKMTRNIMRVILGGV